MVEAAIRSRCDVWKSLRSSLEHGAYVSRDTELLAFISHRRAVEVRYVEWPCHYQVDSGPPVHLRISGIGRDGSHRRQGEMLGISRGVGVATLQADGRLTVAGDKKTVVGTLTSPQGWLPDPDLGTSGRSRSEWHR